MSGDSGMGKSRLFAEIRVLAQVRGFQVVMGRGDAAGGQPYGLWRRITTSLALLTDPTDAEAACLQLVVPDLAIYLRRDLPPAPPLDVPGQQVLFATYETLLDRVALPLVWVLDDLDHADGASRALLAYLAPRIGSRRVLILAGSRRETFEGVDFHEKVRLQRFTPAQIALFVGGALGKSAPSALIDHLLVETEGNPFFLIELLRAMADAAGGLSEIGAGGLEAAVSLHTHDVMVRRLALVPPSASELLETAALAGRRLDLAWLADVEPTVEISTWLRAVAPVLEADGVAWQFGHDRLREALISRQDAVSRRRRHARLAEALERHDATDRVAAIAHHRLAALEDGDALSVIRAIEALDRYGRVLLKAAAPETSEIFDRAMSLLGRLADGPARLALEARLLCGVGAALLQRQQLAEATVPFQRVLAAGRELDDESLQVAGLLGLCRRHFLDANLRQARLVAEEFHAFASGSDQAPTRLLAEVSLGSCLYFRGSGDELPYLEAVPRIAAESPLPVAQLLGGAALEVHPLVAAHSFAAWGFTKRGRTAPALAHAEAAARLDREGRDYFTRRVRQYYLAVLHQYRADPAAVLRTCEEFRTGRVVATDLWARSIRALEAWARVVQQGEGLDELRKSVEFFRRPRFRLTRPYFVGLLAEGELVAGDPEMAEALVADALERIDQSGEDTYRPEQLRLRAAALARRGEREPAVAACHFALDAAGIWPDAVARQRAAWTLWTLKPDADARAILEAATAELDEGFDFPELREARVLLAAGGEAHWIR